MCCTVCGAAKKKYLEMENVLRYQRQSFFLCLWWYSEQMSYSNCPKKPGLAYSNNAYFTNLYIDVIFSNSIFFHSTYKLDNIGFLILNLTFQAY